MSKKAKTAAVVNLSVIEVLNPCKERLDNYRNEYGALTFTYEEFLLLDKITCDDKIWVLRRMVTNVDFWVAFAFDCAFSVDWLNPYNSYEEWIGDATAAAYAAAAAAAAAAYATAAYATAAARKAEQDRQVEALIYLLNAYKI